MDLFSQECLTLAENNFVTLVSIGAGKKDSTFLSVTALKVLASALAILLVAVCATSMSIVYSRDHLAISQYEVTGAVTLNSVETKFVERISTEIKDVNLAAITFVSGTTSLSSIWSVSMSSLGSSNWVSIAIFNNGLCSYFLDNNTPSAVFGIGPGEWKSSNTVKLSGCSSIVPPPKTGHALEWQAIN